MYKTEPVEPGLRTTHEYKKREMAVHRPVYTESAYLSVKRATDVLTALTVIVLVFPWLVPILILIIKLDSRGPAFFKQQRVGYLGRVFTCYKFRTMCINDTSDIKQAQHNDPRITRIGKFLRNTCLDELPQFINVLVGDMSIVGPRPYMLKDSNLFSSVVDNYEFRSLVRPGITGLSQVKGYRGPATTVESIIRRYQWDAYYVKKVSLALDMRIIGQTFRLVLRSLLDRAKPVPHNEILVGHSEAQLKIKKIA